MNFITSMFSRTSISDELPKLKITTLNTNFEVTEDAKVRFFELLNYASNNIKVSNDYKTTIKLIEKNGNVRYFSTYAKII